ncbi:ABC transporter permease [Enterococcus hulanensis]|uniref:ABC transporter permease n=1 Tax=Enterococcus hulanensis TaxID=2559929 RepID=A0ABU3EU18_9ENTE|nr:MULTISPECIES: ABC transporter permease [Enterococcus]MBO0410386.1 ABC transporter permease [Enterococcus hulanensis]MDT2598348.1 ABC transporter permease [Enterococcus hulanensis]MDT2608147.1 ABC transporter permease [Enterococcus hulanensis]MDT2615442.1 ABC transporter permease [Enterococcus hulanensis]MDT2626587.1 ABC transporter permease [Enterococcus hulanensis]
MKRALTQEIIKLIKQRVILKHTLSLFMLIGSLATVTKYGKFGYLTPEKMILSLFNSGWLVVFFMVYLASQTFLMEFRYGTIKNLLNDCSRKKLFAAKIFTLLGYSLYLKGLSVILTIGSTLILFPDLVLGGIFQQNLLADEWFNICGSFIGVWLFASLSLMISLLIKNESLASMLGITIYFVSSMVAGVQFILINHYSWLKWNPFNMLNLANQLSNGGLNHLTQLSIKQLALGNMSYILIFIILSGIIFNKRSI